eukprot:gene169-biopygen160
MPLCAYPMCPLCIHYVHTLCSQQGFEKINNQINSGNHFRRQGAAQAGRTRSGEANLKRTRCKLRDWRDLITYIADLKRCDDWRAQDGAGPTLSIWPSTRARLGSIHAWTKLNPESCPALLHARNPDVGMLQRGPRSINIRRIMYCTNKGGVGQDRAVLERVGPTSRRAGESANISGRIGYLTEEWTGLAYRCKSRMTGD